MIQAQLSTETDFGGDSEFMGHAWQIVEPLGAYVSGPHDLQKPCDEAPSLAEYVPGDCARTTHHKFCQKATQAKCSSNLARSWCRSKENRIQPLPKTYRQDTCKSCSIHTSYQKRHQETTSRAGSYLIQATSAEAAPAIVPYVPEEHGMHADDPEACPSQSVQHFITIRTHEQMH